MNDREKELELELRYTINTLKIMVELAEREGYESTVDRVNETIEGAEKVLANES